MQKPFQSNVKDGNTSDEMRSWILVNERPVHSVERSRKSIVKDRSKADAKAIPVQC